MWRRASSERPGRSEVRWFRFYRHGKSPGDLGLEVGLFIHPLVFSQLSFFERTFSASAVGVARPHRQVRQGPGDWPVVGVDASPWAVHAAQPERACVEANGRSGGMGPG